MTMGPKKAAALGLAAVALTAAAAGRPAGFAYDPQPRWQVEAGTGEVCEAIAAECPGRIRDGAIEASFSYAEIYDADGYMVGLRAVESTGCKSLDEHMLLSHREFRQAFSKADSPDLEDISVETPPGVDRKSVRLVKAGDTQISIGC